MLKATLLPHAPRKYNFVAALVGYAACREYGEQAGTKPIRLMLQLRTPQRIYLPFKRVLDFLCALLALLLFCWLYLILALLVKLTSKGPVFFRQKRIGKGKKTFYIYKFRTMKADTDPNVPTHMLENPEAQITKVGRFLRKTSLDEIPQAFNILAGHMSVIGPRPAS